MPWLTWSNSIWISLNSDTNSKYLSLTIVHTYLLWMELTEHKFRLLKDIGTINFLHVFVFYIYIFCIIYTVLSTYIHWLNSIRLNIRLTAYIKIEFFYTFKRIFIIWLNNSGVQELKITNLLGKNNFTRFDDYK